MLRFFLIISIGLICSALAEQVYQYVDKNGNIVISNKPQPNAKKMNLPPLNTSTTSSTKGYTMSHSSRGMMGNNSINIQSSRYEILNQELIREKKAVEDTQKLIEQNKSLKYDIKDQPQAKERLQLLNDALTEHKKNIEILNKQLN